ncbi:nuclear transport factor 2 family protein [Pacificimonas sp. WHA3]|uniref:Nuclear transport factor 2 family protein n=1 Tax=Pacificimonas pallii TaxID=2827236 RepID=A0ABS6SAG0_9SPHN|nr:nuclear transport factor 2 family protein [Pacificimonas pallii]MBV7255276.1 nuclear transport factor 2 family protein [Pacificimonas pallii]
MGNIRFSNSAGALLTGLMLVGACTQSPVSQDQSGGDAEAIAASLIEADRAYEATNNQAGFQAANEAHFNFEDGFLMEPGQGVLRGKEAILAERSLSAVPSPVRWSADNAMGASSGDFGITWGKFSVDGESTTEGQYLTVWKKDDQGEWKIITDVALDDPQPEAE